MADEPKSQWLNWLAVTTIIFSACATLSTFKGGGFSTKAILAQANASDTWAYFQSKSVKQHSYQLQKDVLDVQVLSATGAQADAMKAKIADYEKEIARYDSEKKEAQEKAQQFEKSRTEYQADSAAFGIAVMFLQVAIMFSGLAALLKKKPVWVIGLGLGVVGLAAFANAVWHIVV